MLILGIDRDVQLTPFTNTAELLRGPQLLLDTLSRPQFGPQNIGVTTEIGSVKVRVAGHYTVGPGFTADGAAAVSSDTFFQIFPDHKAGDISIGLVRLKPNYKADDVAEALRKIVPSDTRVFTRAELLRREQDYWADGTSLGPVFGTGVVLGLIIGIVILYQVMSNDIASRIREYATLKALGYSFRQLVVIVLKEVSAFAIVGFVLGLLMASTLYKFVRDQTGLPVTMDPSTSVAVFLLTLGMCWISGWLATRKIRSADPAGLF
jgi:putative ABC transport system permease protein